MHWYARGMAMAILLLGTLNAASYFVRSEWGGDLLGMTPQNNEAIGFPWLVWEREGTHGVPLSGAYATVSISAMLGNVLCGLALGLIFGTLCYIKRQPLDALVRQFEPASDGPKKATAKFQFSLRGLLALMAVCSLLAAGVSKILAGRPEVLAAIYILGPWGLIALAYVPVRMNWRQRVALIIPLTIILIALAAVAGSFLQPPMELDQTLLGIFVCWTPQAVFAAVAVTVWILWWESLRGNRAAGSTVGALPGQVLQLKDELGQ